MGRSRGTGGVGEEVSEVTDNFQAGIQLEDAAATALRWGHRVGAGRAWGWGKRTRNHVHSVLSETSRGVIKPRLENMSGITLKTETPGGVKLS